MGAIAQDIASRANRALRERAANEDPRDWSDADAWRRFVKVVQSASVWPFGSHGVGGSVPATRDGAIWSYVIADALDTASADILSGEGHITTSTYGARIDF